jgi:hypothetical protein
MNPLDDPPIAFVHVDESAYKVDLELGAATTSIALFRSIW